MHNTIVLNSFAMGDRIPRIIHQTYRDKDSLPLAIQENIRRIASLNTNWECRLYDDSDIETFIQTHYGSGILQIYRKINPSYGAARADFFRYLLIYAQGGVYLDVKSAVTRPLDEVIRPDDCYILSKWDNLKGGKYYAWGMHPEVAALERGEYQQWHVIAAAGHPFLRAVIGRVIERIQHYNAAIDGVGFMGVLRTTGPICYTLAIEEIISQHPFRRVEIEQDMGIEYSIYDSTNADRSKNHRNIFAKHYTELETPVILPEEEIVASRPANAAPPPKPATTQESRSGW